MEKIPFIFKVIAKVYFFFYELIKFPRIFFARRFLWKRYRKKRIMSFELDKEEILTKRFLLNWYLKPNHDKLQTDISSIMKVKEVKYGLIRNKIDYESIYEIITDAIKNGSSKTWEPIIELLESMSNAFPQVKNAVKKMSYDKSGKVRETALLVMEDCNFDKEEQKEMLELLSNDRSKKVRNRVIEIIYRNKKFRKEYVNILKKQVEVEEDNEIKRSLQFVLNNG